MQSLRRAKRTFLPAPAHRAGPDVAPEIAKNAIALVPPRFGPGVVGGAEAVVADMARGLAERGLPVEILSTCARDHFTWANEFAPGVTESEGVVVRRFTTEMPRSSFERDRLGSRILAGEPMTIQDQQRWINASLRCTGLWHHVFDHGHRYRTLVFAPYMFWTTYAVSQLHSRRSIVMPCLHEEPPAHLDIFRAMIEGSGALWFLTDPEQDLASRLYNLPSRHEVVGAPVAAPSSYDPNRFRSKYGIADPFVYYAGRREWGKGWDDLLADSPSSADDGDRVEVPTGAGFELVTSGVGEVVAPLGCESDIIDVGLISDRDRDDAMAAAATYVQPSAMESFSLTVLESLLAGTPVVANRASDVVASHLERSGAGLMFGDRSELVECLSFIADRPAAARNLARSGRDYVLSNYEPEMVFDRLVASLDRWFPNGDDPTVEHQGELGPAGADVTVGAR